jgi:N-acetylglucosamine-6-phosphate deacetylase
MQALINTRIFTGTEILENKAVLINNGTIQSIVSVNEIPLGIDIIDLEGQNIAPAFIDLQIYGGGGCLFNTEISEDTIEKTYFQHRATGTTQLQITLSTMPFEAMLRSIEVCKNYIAKQKKGLIGLHLEGPYFNMVKKGAHLAKYIKKATIEELAVLVKASEELPTYLTFAPEKMDDDCLALLLDSHLMLSLGHSNATYQQAINAIGKGVSRITHLYNAMSPLQSREPGLVGAAYDSNAWASIVVDGIHCDFASVRIAKKIKREKLFLITDAVTEDQRGDYRFHFSGDRYVDDNGTLSGSALTMIQAIKNCVEKVGISLAEALRMASTYPAQVIGVENRLGYIKEGYLANLVVFTNNLEIVRVID